MRTGSVKAFAAGPAVVHAHSMDRGGDLWRRDRFSNATPENDRLLFRALMLEGLVDHLGLEWVAASEARLMDGMLIDAAQANAGEVRTAS